MCQHNHIKIFPSQTTPNSAATQRDSRCQTSTARPDRRRLPRIKGNRNLDRQPLEKLNHHHIKCDLCVSLILVDDKGKRIRLSIRPTDKHNARHISTGRRIKSGSSPRSRGSRDTTTRTHTRHQRQCLDIRSSMPTMKASVISTTGKGTGTNINDAKNASKVIKGNDGARVNDAIARTASGGTTGRAGRGGTARSNVPSSPARKNTHNNKRLQRTDPPSYPKGSAAKGKAKDTTKSVYPLFAKKGITKTAPDHKKICADQTNPLF